MIYNISVLLCQRAMLPHQLKLAAKLKRKNWPKSVKNLNMQCFIVGVECQLAHYVERLKVKREFENMYELMEIERAYQ